MSSGAGGRLTREEYKNKLALEEARKAGTAPAEVDEDGNEINPHIPQYIAQAPWYLQQDHPGLKHQRSLHQKEAGTHDWYKRGQFKGPAARKYRKGACENCGAMTHKKKDCVERPRKIGAKFTNKDIRPDEIVEKLQFDYEGSHDRWNGYDTRLHNLRVEKFHQEEEERRAQREKELEEEVQKKREAGDTAGTDADGDADATVAEEGLLEDESAAGAGMQKRDERSRMTVRNLRIREDTAKYLRNLDTESAYYDPKTRSMRENPTPNVPVEKSGFAGDNFVRASGENQDFRDLQGFAWDASDKGSKVNVMSNPSQAEFLYKEFQEKRDNLKKKQQDSVLAKYGGEEHLNSIPRELRLAQTERYVEYSRDGKLLKGEEAPVPKSKYEEDVHPNGHSSVWGSYWVDGSWGYKCCHSTMRASVCLGEAGIEAEQALLKEALARKEQSGPARKTLQEQAADAAANPEKYKDALKKSKKKGEELTKEQKLKQALAEEEERARAGANGALDDRKRKYNSLSGGADDYEATDEQMEAYHMKKKRWEDPMQAVGGDELLPLEGDKKK